MARKGKKGTHLMDYIPDKTLFKAVMFARSMIRNGTRPDIANDRAAKHYRVSVSDVGHYVGQVGGTVSGSKRKGKQGGRNNG